MGKFFRQLFSAKGIFISLLILIALSVSVYAVLKQRAEIRSKAGGGTVPAELPVTEFGTILSRATVIGGPEVQSSNTLSLALTPTPQSTCNKDSSGNPICPNMGAVTCPNGIATITGFDSCGCPLPPTCAPFPTTSTRIPTRILTPTLTLGPTRVPTVSLPTPRPVSMYYLRTANGRTYDLYQKVYPQPTCSAEPCPAYMLPAPLEFSKYVGQQVMLQGFLQKDLMTLSTWWPIPTNLRFMVTLIYPASFVAEMDFPIDKLGISNQYGGFNVYTLANLHNVPTPTCTGNNCPVFSPLPPGVSPNPPAPVRIQVRSSMWDLQQYLNTSIGVGGRVYYLPGTKDYFVDVAKTALPGTTTTPAPTCIPYPPCAFGIKTESGATMICDLRPEVNYCPPPTIPPGCYYRQVQCFQAPCDPVLTCPSTTPSQNFCTGKSNGTACDASGCPVCPPGSTQCPRLACPYTPGTCQNGQCIQTWITQPPSSCTGKPDGTICNAGDCFPGPVEAGGTERATVCRLLTGSCQSGKCVPLPTITPIQNSIRVTAPNGGENLIVGQTYNITWQSSGGIKGFLIYLVNSQGQVSLINGTDANARSYSWTVNSPMGMGQHKIKIMDNSTGGIGDVTQDMSDNFFTISQSNQPFNFEFHIRFAGVNDGSADGATATIRFVGNNGVNMITPPVVFHHIGGGIYSAVVTMPTTLLVPGPGYVLIVKAEKHVAKKFCQQTGQKGPCQPAIYLNLPLTTKPAPFDLTGMPLQPGDLPPQDGIVDGNDFTRLTDLLEKPCSSLTTEEKYVGDLNYDGCATVKDVFLFRQTLQTRYDEN